MNKSVGGCSPGGGQGACSSKPSVSPSGHIGTSPPCLLLTPPLAPPVPADVGARAFLLLRGGRLLPAQPELRDHQEARMPRPPDCWALHAEVCQGGQLLGRGPLGQQHPWERGPSPGLGLLGSLCHLRSGCGQRHRLHHFSQGCSCKRAVNTPCGSPSFASAGD